MGVHVPEPIVSRADGPDPEQEAILADSVGLALLVVLETLTPAERLAFVLHDVFAVPFDEIAPIVDRTPTATRQLASRARRRVQGTAVGARCRPRPPARGGRGVRRGLARGRLRGRCWRCSTRMSSSGPTSGPRAASSGEVRGAARGRRAGDDSSGDWRPARVAPSSTAPRGPSSSRRIGPTRSSGSPSDRGRSSRSTSWRTRRGWPASTSRCSTPERRAHGARGGSSAVTVSGPLPASGPPRRPGRPRCRCRRCPWRGSPRR